MRPFRSPFRTGSNPSARFTVTVAALALAFACGTGIARADSGAGAQASPAPTTAPQIQPQNPGQPAIPPKKSSKTAALSHLPIIDFVATFTQPAYYSNNSQIQGYDPIDLGGTVRVPVTRRFNLFFDRITEGTINQPLEHQGKIFPNDNRDIILQYHGTYNITNNVSLDLGESFRHRIWSSGAPIVSNRPFPTTIASVEHHFAYGTLSYVTKPVKELLGSTFVLSETLDVQNVDHHVGALCSAANVAAGVNQCVTAGAVGVVDENPGKSRYYETTQGVTWIVPVDKKHGTTFVANERWGALNFYENAPFPYRYATALTYQLNKTFSPGFTLSLRHADLHQLEQGAPFASPSAIHVGSYDILGTFHLDTNTLFH